MSNSKVKKTLQRGLGLAAGLVVANAVVMPLISDRTPSAGLMIGVIAGFLALVVYTCIAIVQTRRDAES